MFANILVLRSSSNAGTLNHKVTSGISTILGFKRKGPFNFGKPLEIEFKIFVTVKAVLVVNRLYSV